jgi:heat shock protein HslJ
LLPDGRVAIKADCNRARGTYSIDAPSITFSELASTRAACGPDSISDRFLTNLGYVVGFVRTGELNDQLILEMMADGGQLTFDPALTGVVWEWIEFQGGDGSLVRADDPSRYTIEFLDDGSVAVVADCNQGGGDANVDGTSIDLTVATTLIGCPEESQASEFLRYLDEAVSFVFRDGRLALSLPMDAGIAFFRPTVPPSPPATPEATVTG